jgi:hypothetical protein
VPRPFSRRKLFPLAAMPVVAALPLFGGVTSGAAASTGHAANKTHHVTYGNIPRDFKTSSWGGYVATGSSGTFTSVTASWIEPKVSCDNDNALYAPWVGIDGYENQTVEQTGVQTYCGTGKPVDAAWYEMYPASAVYYSNKIKAGDSITATVTSSGSSFTLTISDTTRGWTQTATQSTDGAEHATAEAVIESPTEDYPDISRVNFTGVEFNGVPLDTFSLLKFSTDSGSGTTVYHPTKITDGDDFSMVPRR